MRYTHYCSSAMWSWIFSMSGFASGNLQCLTAGLGKIHDNVVKKGWVPHNTEFLLHATYKHYTPECIIGGPRGCWSHACSLVYEECIHICRIVKIWRRNLTQLRMYVHILYLCARRFLDPDWWRKGAGRKEDSEMFRELTFRLGFLMQVRAPPLVRASA